MLPLMCDGEEVPADYRNLKASELIELYVMHVKADSDDFTCRWVKPNGPTAGKLNAIRRRLIEGSSSSLSFGKKKKTSLLPKKISSETMKSDSKKRKRGSDDMDCDEESSSKSIKKQENIRYRILKQKMQSKLGNSWVDVMKEFFHDIHPRIP